MSVKVTIPEPCCHCICPDILCTNQQHVCDIFAYNKLANGDISVMSPFQIWLRNKGIQNGSSSPLFFPLCFEQNIKLLIVKNDEYKICKSSLEHYFNNRFVSFNFVIHCIEGLKEVYSDISSNSHLEVILVTTWQSGDLAQEVVKN
jgi:hypothetical protein